VKSNISRGKTKLRKILTRESTQEQKLEKAS